MDFSYLHGQYSKPHFATPENGYFYQYSRYADYRNMLELPFPAPLPLQYHPNYWSNYQVATASDLISSNTDYVTSNGNNGISHISHQQDTKSIVPPVEPSPCPAFTDKQIAVKEKKFNLFRPWSSSTLENGKEVEDGFKEKRKTQLYDKIDKPYQCTTCGQRFIRKYNLNTHVKSHKTRTFTCDYCPEVFQNRMHLKKHRWMRHLESMDKNSMLIGPKLMYPCEPCQKVYQHKSQLITHLVSARHDIFLASNDDYPSMWTMEDEWIQTWRMSKIVQSSSG